MNDITKRIEELLIYFRVSPNKFATNCKLGSSNLGKMLKGTMPITDATIEKIIKSYPQVSFDWLKFGQGEMLLPKQESNVSIVGPYVKPELGNPGVFRLPSLPISAQATFAESFNNDVKVNPLEDFRDVQLLPEEIPIRSSLTTIQVDGESMEMTLIDGAWVLCRQLKDSQWGNVGGVVFVSYGNYFVVKRIKKNRLFSENYIILESDNKEYGEMTVQLSDIHAMWKAMRIISSPIL